MHCGLPFSMPIGHTMFSFPFCVGENIPQQLIVQFQTGNLFVRIPDFIGEIEKYVPMLELNS